MKFYLNDVGLLTNIFYRTNINAILNETKSVNLGSVYETVVATELIAHGYNLFYYDNKDKGEVDYIIDDYQNLSTLPIEVKSGKDYSIHSALNNLVSNDAYNIQKAYVLSNKRLIKQKGKNTTITKEPGGTEVGQEIRRLLVCGDKDKFDALAEALLYFADRHVHLVQKI